MTDWSILTTAVIVGGSAVATVFQKNLLYAAILLMMTLLGTAALFIQMDAEFIAVSQIVVYVGGVLVLIIFGILLTNRITGASISTDQYRIIPSILLGGMLFYMIIIMVGNTFAVEKQMLSAQENVPTIGINLMTENILVFELIAILLLVALVGAATIAEGRKE